MKYLLVNIFFCSLPFLTRAQDWKSFSDSSFKFTVSYPDNWEKKIKEGDKLFLTSPQDNEDDKFRENINVSTTYNADFGTTYKIEELSPDVITELKSSLNEFTQESIREFKWNKMDAFELKFTCVTKADKPIKARIIQWFCFYRQQLFLVTYTASADDDSHNKTAERIMNSIVFK